MLAILLYVGLYVPCAVICTSILFSPDAPFIGGIIIIIIMLVVVVAPRVYKSHTHNKSPYHNYVYTTIAGLKSISTLYWDSDDNNGYFCV